MNIIRTTRPVRSGARCAQSQRENKKWEHGRQGGFGNTEGGFAQKNRGGNCRGGIDTRPCPLKEKREASGTVPARARRRLIPSTHGQMHPQTRQNCGVKGCCGSEGVHRSAQRHAGQPIQQPAATLIDEVDALGTGLAGAVLACDGGLNGEGGNAGFGLGDDRQG